MRDGLLITRRNLLIGCSLAATPLLTRIGFAAAPGDNRLVVIVLRGAMDGLDVVRPLGDAGYAALRPRLMKNAGEPFDLDGFFALHPALAPLLPWWGRGELGFAHAVATPYRAQRSHFTGQDLLENGSGSPDGVLAAAGDGWLNRAVGLIAGARAVAVGAEPMLILQGAAPADQWLPVPDSALSGQGQALLSALHGADPAFAAAFAQSQLLRAETEDAAGGVNPIGGYVADRLNGPARIATFSLGGWDTHQNQARIMAARLADLAQTLTSLRDGLGQHWGSTLVLAITEFGRTARENGSGGTDHGTGGVALLAGGALNGGRVLGDWPGLGAGALYRDRDLMPTSDVRALAGWALRGMFGLGRAAIETSVFPGLTLGRDPGLLR